MFSSGTFGATGSGAQNIFDEYFAGMGIISVVAAGVPGDFNNDGKVDAADYVVWRKNEGTTNTLPNDGGIGGTVGAAHFNLWRANFGNMQMPGSGSGAPVPEPATLTLVAMAALVAARPRRWRGTPKSGCRL
jgi:hypothetical protein